MLTRNQRNLIMELVLHPSVSTIDIGERKDYTSVWIHMERDCDSEEIIEEIKEVFENIELKENSRKNEDGVEKISYNCCNKDLYLYLFCENTFQEQEEAV